MSMNIDIRLFVLEQRITHTGIGKVEMCVKRTFEMHIYVCVMMMTCRIVLYYTFFSLGVKHTGKDKTELTNKSAQDRRYKSE